MDTADGTHEFMSSGEDYCIIIGFMDHNQVQFGVTYQPSMKRLIIGKKGKGAWCNGKKIESTREKDLKKVLVGTPLLYFAKNNKLDEGLALYKKVLEQCFDARWYGSAGLDFYRVASGKAGVYYEYGLKPWDIAAGSVIVKEAGGVITKPDGSPLDIFQRKDGKWYVECLAAGNAVLHQRMVELLTKKE